MKKDRLTPVGESEIVRLLGEKKFDRRTFGKGLVAVLGSLAGATIAELGFDILPKLVHNLVLTPHEEHLLYAKIFNQTTRFGIGMYPDFGVRGQDAIQDAFHLGKKEDVVQIGSFALLEDMATPSVMLAHGKRLKAIEDSGQIPQLSLGTGAFFQPHPFDDRHLDTQKKLIDQWIDFLYKNTSGIVHIRFLFEANLYKGDIAYRNDGSMSQEKHQAYFKTIFEYFSSQIHQHNEASQRLFLDLSFSAAGAGIAEYFPQCDVRAAGIDVYSDIYGRYALWSLYEHIFDTQRTLLKNYILVDALTKVKKHFGENTRVVLHEIGATTEDLDWFKSALLLFLAAGGEEIMYFGINKTETEQRDFTLTPAVIDIMKTMVSL